MKIEKPPFRPPAPPGRPSAIVSPGMPPHPGLPQPDMSQHIAQLEMAAINNELTLILYLNLFGPLPDGLVSKVKTTLDLLPPTSRDFATLRGVVKDVACKWALEQVEVVPLVENLPANTDAPSPTLAAPIATPED